jgi:hypothetical protein
MLFLGKTKLVEGLSCQTMMVQSFLLMSKVKNSKSTLDNFKIPQLTPDHPLNTSRHSPHPAVSPNKRQFGNNCVASPLQDVFYAHRHMLIITAQTCRSP